MKLTRSYKVALILAICLHVALLVFLTSSKHQTTSYTFAHNKQAEKKMVQTKIEPIKATSIDAKELDNTIKRLREEKLAKERMEQEHQQMLANKARELRQQAKREKQRLAKLEEKARKLKAAQEEKLAEEKKRFAEEKKNLAKLQEQKRKEEQRLAELHKEKEALKALKEKEANRIAKIKKEEEQRRQKAIKEQEEKARLAAIEKAKAEAERRREIAGIVDKYKALIVNSISREWILPDNIDESKSCQFRIRLAPTGTVLEVSLTRSSGDPILDRSAQSAIYKASPLPVPKDIDAFNEFRDIRLTVRPESVRG